MKKLIILAGMLVLAGSIFASPGPRLPLSIVHATVLRDFILRFDDVTASRWVKSDKGSTMYFTKDGYNNRAVYDHKGKWQYALLFYNEAKMPHDIRAVVKREYYDFDISVVEEVWATAGKAWLVHLEDESTHRIVKVNTDLEMETMEEYVKL
jgi:hypothetical protein